MFFILLSSLILEIRGNRATMKRIHGLLFALRPEFPLACTAGSVNDVFHGPGKPVDSIVLSESRLVVYE
jgi:hypothetical protein